MSFAPVLFPTVQEAMQGIVSCVRPAVQGPANRRIKLRIEEMGMIPAETSESLETANNYLAQTDEHPNQGQPPTCLLGIFSRRTSNQMRAKALFVVLILLALFLSLLGGPREGIRTSYATLYKHFWQRM